MASQSDINKVDKIRPMLIICLFMLLKKLALFRRAVDANIDQFKVFVYNRHKGVCAGMTIPDDAGG